MKQKMTVWVLMICGLFGASFATMDIWKSDPNHSELGFEIKHLGISEISGHFTEFESKMTTSKPDFSDAKIEMTAQVKSVNTRVPARDEHLRGADFFNVAKHPTLTFVSKSALPVKDKNRKYLITGDLTLAGVTKSVQFELEYNGKVQNPQTKAEVLGFEMEGKIKRSDFNFGSQFPNAMLSDEVEIFANLEYTK